MLILQNLLTQYNDIILFIFLSLLDIYWYMPLKSVIPDVSKIIIP